MLERFIIDTKSSYEQELQFYTNFHMNEINWRLHAICVPIEWMTFLMFTAYFNLEFVIVLTVSIYYLLLNNQYANASAFMQILVALLIRKAYGVW